MDQVITCTIFWNNMKKVAAEVQEGLFHTGLNKILEVSAFSKHFTEAASKVEGSGWAIRLGSAIGKIRNFTEYTTSIIYTMGYDTAPRLCVGTCVLFTIQNRKDEYIKIGGML